MGEDIAIIGISGRFPNASNINQFWENLCLGKESITFLTEDHLRASGVSEEHLQNPTYVKAAALLGGIDLFDAEFFDISSRDAIAMDPQHRFFLECAWEALEDGGYLPVHKALDVGVFAGAGPNTTSYLLEYIKAYPEIQGISSNYHSWGTDKDYFTTRASFKLNLTGPSINVQTGCSTSLVAVHQACEAIQQNYCSLALAGGVCIRIPHIMGYLHSEGDIYSHDGRCRTFDAKSSGTVFGSGIGLVLLKKLSQAIKDRDRVYAVIKSSFINNDGNSKLSYPAPSSQGQALCISQGLARANIDPATIQLVEAHGTGTIKGDPVEFQSLSQAFDSCKKGLCAIGSIKPNIGHLGPASGIASFIKLTLALFHKKLPAHINYEEPNPLIDFPNSPFYINCETKDWKDSGRPRRGAINSFGVGGTNAFAILEEAPFIEENPHLPKMPFWPFTLSAKTKKALEAQVDQLASFLRDHPDVLMADVSYTLNCRRTHFSHRLFFQAATHEECLSILKDKTFQQTIASSSESPFECPYIQMAMKLTSYEEWKIFLNTLGNAYLAAQPINWNTLHSLFEGKTVSLPTYPFQGKRYWVQTPHTHSYPSSRIHPLLGWKVDTSVVTSDFLFENFLYSDELPYLKEHRIFDQMIFPATGFLELFSSAAQSIGLSLPLKISDIVFNKALLIKNQVRIQTKLKRIDEGFEATVYSFDHNTWHVHAIGKIDTLNTRFDVVENSTPECGSIDNFYTNLKNQGYEYGPHFKTLRAFLLSKGKSWGLLKTEDQTQNYTIYPPLLDGSFQLNIAAQANDSPSNSPGTLTVPFAIKELFVFEQMPQEVNACVDVTESTSAIKIYTPSGRCILEVRGLEKKCIDRELLCQVLDDSQDHLDLLYHELWLMSQKEKAAHLIQENKWLLVSSSESAPLFHQVKKKLRDLGKDCIEIILCERKDLTELSSFLQQAKPIQGIVNFLPYESLDFAIEATISLQQAYLTVFDQLPPLSFTLTKNLHTYQNQPQLYSPLIGLHRSLKLEFSNRHFILIDIDTSLDQHRAVEYLVDELIHPDLEPEVFLSEEGRYVNRIVSHKEAIKRHYYLPFVAASNFLQKGSTIAELSWKSQAPQQLQDDEVEVSVKSAALNFRDLLNALKLYPGESGSLGSDFCGVIKNKGSQVKHLEIGQTVFGLAPGTLQNNIITQSAMVAEKPLELNSIEASGIPIVFLTTYYALKHLAKLKKNDKILIHAATGGIGLAAIQIAQQMGAEVFATVSSARKKEHLFSLGVNHVYSSRNLNYVEELKDLSVNVVLNSLSGAGFIEGSLNILAQGGCFLELGKRNIWTDEQIAHVRPDVGYFIVAIDAFRKNNPDKIQALLREVTPEFEKKQLMPLPHTLFPAAKIKTAFQFFQQAKQIGKVVIKFPNSWKEQLAQSSYLIIGGTGNLGIKTAEWLIGQGAKHLILVSRGGSANLEQYQKKGIEITTVACDITQEDQLTSLFNQLKSYPPLKGIIHAAGALHNAGFLQHTWQDFEKIFSPKVKGTLLLHQEILKHQLNLDFIVYFSSTSAFLGGHGRSAYAAANGFLDHFARYQQHLGLPAISLNFGAWGETGMAIPHLKKMQFMGNKGLSTKEALQCLDYALNAQDANLAITRTDWNEYIPVMAKDNPRFILLKKQSRDISDNKSATMMQKLEEASQEKRSLMLQDFLTDIMRKILGESQDYPLDIKKPFIHQGLDSLNQIEFLIQIKKNIQLKKNLRVNDLQIYPTLITLAHYLFDHLSIEHRFEKHELAPGFSLSLEEPQWHPLALTISHYWHTLFPNVFNIGYATRFHHDVNIEKLNQAFNRLLKQHPIFYFIISHSSPSYKIAPFKSFELELLDLSQTEEVEKELTESFKRLINAPIEAVPQLKGILCKIGQGTHELQIACPHVISDGRSLQLFMKELDSTYTHLLQGKNPPSYRQEKDFLARYQSHDAILTEDQELKSQLINRHFKNYQPFQVECLEDTSTACSPVTLNYTRSFRRAFQASCHEIGIELSLALNGLAALALSLITNQSDFTVLYSSDGIFSPDFAEVIGPFHKQLPLCISRKGARTLNDYITDLKEHQRLWSYLREYPSELLKMPLFKPPCKPIPKQEGMFNSLLNRIMPSYSMPKPIPDKFLIYLSITEREIKHFSNCTTHFRNYLLDQCLKSNALINLLSVLIDDEWTLYLSWPYHKKNQQLFRAYLGELMQNFITSRNYNIE